MKIDWDIHHIIDKPVSYHTHGLDQFDSLEIEIALPLYPHEGALFCNTIGAAIRDGLKLEDGKMVEHLFNVPVFFFKTMPLHGDKEVFRVVFPDKNGLFPWDMEGSVRCEEHYKEQIFFEKDKCFWVEVADCEAFEQHKNMSVLDGFEKRNGVYARPLMYFVGGDMDGLIRIPPYMSGLNPINRCINDLAYWGEFKPSDIQILCRDVDSTDPMNKSFCEWKEKHGYER